MEWQARVSNREVGRWYQRTEWSTVSNDSENISVNRYEQTRLLSIVYDQSWAVNWSLLSFQTRGTQPFQAKINYGNNGGVFQPWQKTLLENAFKRISSKDCIDYINKELEPYVTALIEDHPFAKNMKEPTALSAKDILSKIQINKYTAGLTREKMNISEPDYKKTTDQANSFSGFNGASVGNRMWLSDSAFRVSQGWSGGADLSAIIVHEIFHALFPSKTEEEIKKRNEEIQKNCGRGWGDI
jgi:hypothetical protein